MGFNLTVKKKAITLTIILAFLTFTYVLGMVFSSENIQNRKAQEPVFAILNKESVARIEIMEADLPTELEKKGEDWVVMIMNTAFPALESRIDSLLDLVISLKKSQVVSANPENWQNFEVSGENSKQLKLFNSSGKVIAHLHVGKSGLGSKGNYIRLEGSNEVIQSDRSLNFYINSSEKFWSDLRLFARDLTGEDIMRITIRSRISFLGQESKAQSLDYTLLLDNIAGVETWQAEGMDSYPLSAKSVDGIANSLASFEGNEFIVDVAQDKAGFADPVAEIEFTTIDDASYRLQVGTYLEETNQYYIKLAGQPYGYTAAAWRLEKILVPVETLADKEQAD
ncbi:MAG: DUF4340 domain-containing protein [Spirochaeta sp.]|nr:DUF4340 domain-containing protein [Spirochaeta sp.]